MAQSVPSAKRLPCIRSLPLGWSFSGATIVRGRANFELLVVGGDGGNGSIQLQLGSGGAAVVDVTLTPTCSSPNGDSAITVMEIEGGCVTYRSLLPSGVGPVPSFDPGGAVLSFTPRSQLVASVKGDEDLFLCGTGGPCP